MTTLILAFVYPLVVGIIIRLQVVLRTMRATVLTVVTKDDTVHTIPLTDLRTNRSWTDPVWVYVTVPSKEHR